MAKWLVKCAGGCGQTLHRGPRSLPRPMCLACRRRRAVLLCSWCNMPFHSSGGHLAAEYCCRKHAALGTWLGRRFFDLTPL